MSKEKETFRVELTQDEFPELGELLSALDPSSRNGNSQTNLMVLQVAEVDGFKFEIYAKEHPPPHFHISFNDKNVAFSIPDCKPMKGSKVKGKELRFIKRWAKKNQAKLIDKWNESRPDDCPVGPIKQ